MEAGPGMLARAALWQSWHVGSMGRRRFPFFAVPIMRVPSIIRTERTDLRTGYVVVGRSVSRGRVARRRTSGRRRGIRPPPMDDAEEGVLLLHCSDLLPKREDLTWKGCGSYLSGRAVATVWSSVMRYWVSRMRSRRRGVRSEGIMS